MMTTPTATDVNEKKIVRLQALWDDLLHESLRRGFFGTVAVELCVADGTIQHFRRKIERMDC